MKLVQIADTHGLHHQLTLPDGDVLVHCGDFSHRGTEEEVLDFLNWFIELPYRHKLFVTGNHDICLWDAVSIEDLPEDVIFLQDRGAVISGVSFFGLGYNHDEELIPSKTDILITHEPPLHILDLSNNINFGNLAIKQKVQQISPEYHLFGHAHEAYGISKIGDVVYSNAALTDNAGRLAYMPRVIEI